MIGGSAGVGCMSALRMAARRASLIDLTPPQRTKDWLAEQIGFEPTGPASHHLADALIHIAVGVSAGAAYGAMVEDRRRTSLAVGAFFGLGVWAAAFGVVAPSLGITRSPRQGRWMETAVNVAAHLVYGTVTALVTGELAQQAHGPGATVRRARARIG
jgi:uncharacterized membrane protein YagU involved in acid resistance